MLRIISYRPYSVAVPDAIIQHSSMTKLKPGDRVDCRVKNGTIVSPYKEYDEVRTFEVVSTDKYGYWLYVPPYYNIKATAVVDQYRCKNLGIDKRFLNAEIVYIQENQICQISSILDGMSCANCGEFYHLAESNQEDGTLVCWSCRFNPYR